MIYDITEKCKTATINLVRKENIRKYLTQEACDTLVLGIGFVHQDF